MTSRRNVANSIKCLAVVLAVLFGTLTGYDSVLAQHQEGEAGT